MSRPSQKGEEYKRIAEELRVNGGVLALDAADMVEWLGRRQMKEAAERKKPWYKKAKRLGLL